MKVLVDWFTSNPKLLFKIDAIGAILSAFLLGVVLVYFQDYIGIPEYTLYLLAVFPVFFAVFDFIAIGNEEGISANLKIVSIMNASYCLISVSFAFVHISSITVLGWFYIIGEVLIVLLLAILEYRVSLSTSTN